MANESITQKELKELFDYFPCSGEFIRKKHIHYNAKIGDKAGCINTAGYVQISIKGVLFLAHRLAWTYMTGETPVFIDHINHDRSDNRWENLRQTTHQENCKNCTFSKANTSGCTGVIWADNRWVARIKVNYKEIVIGRFVKFSDAVKARKSAEIKYGFHENHGAKQVSTQ